ncbi:MAG: hypothetical protein GY949_10130 [Gammaproteobacteria bacterium]|nr:hypothetical protein [Gammaproteobacteria bacterium]
MTTIDSIKCAPLELSFNRPGTILVRRNGACVRSGSHLFMIVAEMGRDDVISIN